VRSGWRSLQINNRYVLHPVSTEFSQRTVSQSESNEILHLTASHAEVVAAQATLARRRAVVEGMLMKNARPIFS
jgi:hypothetical protein